MKHCHRIQFPSLSSAFPCVGFRLRFYHWFLREPVMPLPWYQGRQMGQPRHCFPPPAVPANMSLTLIGFKFIIQPTPVAKEMWCWEEPRLSYRCKDSAHRLRTGLWNSTTTISNNLYLPQVSVPIFSLTLFSGAELLKPYNFQCDRSVWQRTPKYLRISLVLEAFFVLMR